MSNNLTRALCALATITLSSCEWFSDFKSQPKVDPWEVVSSDSMKTRGANDTVASRGNPQHSVPIYGMQVPAFAVSYMPLPATVDSMRGLVNPVVPDERSLGEGRKYYQINCAVCHGNEGNGDGPAIKYGMPGIGLTNDNVKGYTDGYIWGMIRNGRGLMPSYNRIEELNRWDVVNYVRGLQGLLPDSVPTKPLGVPGENGNRVPGPTRMGPTRPSPYFQMPRAAGTEMRGVAQSSDSAPPPAVGSPLIPRRARATITTSPADSAREPRQ